MEMLVNAGVLGWMRLMMGKMRLQFREAGKPAKEKRKSGWLGNDGSAFLVGVGDGGRSVYLTFVFLKLEISCCHNRTLRTHWNDMN